jgi:hypothetical protein
MCIFHKWTKWKVISDRKAGFTIRQIIQMKECEKCGLQKFKTTDID